MLSSNLVKITDLTFHRQLPTEDRTLCRRSGFTPVTIADDLSKMAECKSCRREWQKIVDAHWAAERAATQDDAPVPALPPVEIVTFNGEEYEIIDQREDYICPRDTDADWLTLKATDGSGCIWIQRRDLDMTAPLTTDSGAGESRKSNDYAGTPSLEVTPLAHDLISDPTDLPTPVRLRALALARKVGSWVTMGDYGSGLLSSVSGGYATVSMSWGVDWLFDVRDVKLSPVNALV